MKWKDIKGGTLIALKKEEYIYPSNYWMGDPCEYTHICIISDVQFKDHPKSRKRHFYFRAVFYNDKEEKVMIGEFDRSMMRSHFKMIDDDKLKKKITSMAILEAL